VQLLERATAAMPAWRTASAPARTAAWAGSPRYVDINWTSLELALVAHRPDDRAASTPMSVVAGWWRSSIARIPSAALAPIKFVAA